jgi:hypothetical protein
MLTYFPAYQPYRNSHFTFQGELDLESIENFVKGGFAQNIDL